MQKFYLENISKEKLIELANVSNSINELCKKVGYASVNNKYAYKIRKLLQLYEYDFNNLKIGK